MTQAELYKGLKEIGFPVAYSHFEETDQASIPITPYITYSYTYSSDFVADSKNYVEKSNFQIELYTKTKDLESEMLVQEKLQEMGLVYTKVGTYLDSEKLYQMIYEIRI